MKIGIITFHRAVNYGAVLQAYALQHALEGLGAQAEILDYRNRYIESCYDPYSLKGNKLKALAKIALLGGVRRKKNEAFRSFNKKYLRLSESVYKDSEQLAGAEKFYDAFITGSDQVWNTGCADFDPAYFLTFVKDKKKKNSYAASFGLTEIPKEYEAEYKKRLAGYRQISVREAQGRALVKELTGRDVPVVLDPTLLLTEKDWAAAAHDIPHKGYILLYSVLESDGMFAYARRLSKETGLPVLYLNDKSFENRDLQYVRGASPEEFLGYFKNADYVITNSFHGTVFSVIFKRRFLSDTDVIKEGKPGKNERSQQLLEALSLTQRILTDKANINAPTNWEAVERELDGLRWKSFEYLNTIVDEEDGK